MKRVKLLVVISLIVAALGGMMYFIKNNEKNINVYEFKANIEEINESSLLVSPLHISQEYKSSDLIYINISEDVSVEEFVIGDLIIIKYDGIIAESYPAQINNIYEIKKVEK